MSMTAKVNKFLDKFSSTQKNYFLLLLNAVLIIATAAAASAGQMEIAAGALVLCVGFGFLLRPKMSGVAIEDRMRASVLKSIRNNVMIADNDDTLIYMNDISYESLTNLEDIIKGQFSGFSVSRAIGSSIHNMHKDPERIRQILRNLKPGQIHTGKIQIGTETLELNVSGIFDGEKRLGSYAEWSNLTEQLKLAEQKEMIDSCIASLNSNVMIADNDDNLSWMNKVSYDSLKDMEPIIQKDFPNFMVDKAIGSSIHNMHKDPQRIKNILGALKEGETNSANISIGGQTLSLNVGALFSNGKRVGSFAEWQNITQQMKMEEDKKRLEEDIHSTAMNVNEASSEIAEGNINLSERTEAQAANIEQTTASMQMVTEKVEENARTADETLQLVQIASDIADEGGMVVKNAMEAMEEINKSSTEISNIISVVDEIAFQTNLLALNAAVEAARAGEQGRGFAVVASEVRTLAGRSATAAKEIKDLISKSVEKVKTGTAQVNSTGENLTKIIDNVKSVSEKVAQISGASQEQSESIAEINKAIQQMDAFTQQNAALVEEAASASKSLQDQASSMISLVSGGGKAQKPRTYKDGLVAAE